MFETSRVITHVAVQRRYGLLTISFAIHTAVIAGILLVTVSSVSFPTRSPNELSRYNAVAPVIIPKPPASGGTPRSSPAPVQRAAQATPVAVALDRIPDSVQPFVGSQTSSDRNAPTGNGPTSSDGIEDWMGEIGGIDIGQPVATPAGSPDVYPPGGDVRSAVVLHRVEPQYPRTALMARLAGLVVIECIIDRDGHVRDAHVLRSSFSIFDEPALTALRQWRFSPGSLHGRSGHGRSGWKVIEVISRRWSVFGDSMASTGAVPLITGH
jgi:TonB family protein